MFVANFFSIIMNKHDLCCIGHITHDKIVTPKSTVHMPGGTSFYFANAIKHFDDVDFALVTAVGKSEKYVVDEMLAEGICVKSMPSRYSVYFENIYGENQDNRKQRVLSKADPFQVDFLKDVEASIFHLGSLLADDFPPEVVKYLATKSLVSADSQGYLREVRDEKVYPISWAGMEDVLPYIHFLKANEHEMDVLTGHSDVRGAALKIYELGVKEVLITLGSLGSVIYDGTDFHIIPAYKPKEVVDATGCGDTYMTGYLYRRAKGDDIDSAGKFAAAMSTLKIEGSGPFKGTKEDVIRCMNEAEQHLPEI